MKLMTLFNSFIRPGLSIFLFLFIITGIIYPVTMTILGQVFIPYQSNGSIITINNESRGSFIIGQVNHSPALIHPVHLNTSASGVDPDITPEQAYIQIPRISNVTGISSTNLSILVNKNINIQSDVNFGIFASDYVNVNQLNFDLITSYPNIYYQFLNP